MLVVFSDLHLTDGSTAKSPHSTAFALLQDNLVGLARAKRAQEIQLVLLGDILDLVRTDYWHRNTSPDERPWGGTLDPETGMNADVSPEPQFGAILNDILAGPACKALIRMIKSVGERTDRTPRVTYVVGNHDRPLNNFASLRQRVAAAFAPIQVEFATEYRSDEYRVLARHGHEWDRHCHGWRFRTKVLRKDRRIGRFDAPAYETMAIGEVVTAELMSGLVYNARQRLRRPGDREFLDQLLDVNNLRPMTDVFDWITWMTRDRAQRITEECGAALRAALDGVLDSSFARRWDALKRDFIVAGDLTDHLQKARALLGKGGNVGRLRKLIPILDQVNAALASVKGSTDEHVRGAAEEMKDLPDDSPIEFILYGHTHRARQDCFSASHDGRARLYINTGTFLRLIRRAADRSFFGSNRMTYVCFYREDEDRDGRADRGPTMDVWDGMKLKNYRPEP